MIDMVNMHGDLGDLIIYDTTHCTNIHGMYLGIFCCINSFNETEIVGWNLQTNQDELSFDWIF